MPTASCPSCGADVSVSDALFCPFCGQALRKVFATQPPSSDASLPSFTPAPTTTPTTEQPVTMPPSGAQTLWTPYPEQGTLPGMRAPAPLSGPIPPPPISARPSLESPSGNYPYASGAYTPGPTPATEHLARVDGAIWATLVVIAITGLVIYFRVSLAMWLTAHVSFRPLYLKYDLAFLLLLAPVALAGAYWIAWQRLAHRTTARVMVEAAGFCLAFFLAEPICIEFVFAHGADPDTFLATHPFEWLLFVKDYRAMMVWIAALSLTAGILGVWLALGCARWTLARQRSKRPDSTGGAARIVGSFVVCAGLFLVCYVLAVKSTNYGFSIKLLELSAGYRVVALLAATPIVVAILAALAGVRRLRKG